MKLKNLLDKIDRLKPNSVDEQDKIDWINEIDERVYNDIYLKAEDYLGEFIPLVKGDEEKEVLIPSLYSEIYYYYLAAKIDFVNDEIASYNNNMALYNSMYTDFAAYYRRNHVPKQTGEIKYC
jgi:hypothetical protein